MKRLSLLMILCVTAPATAMAHTAHPTHHVHYHAANLHEFKQIGTASWYGKQFANHKTSSGVKFNPRAMTAAHRTLPLGSRVKVTNENTGKTVVVTINDRGPYHGRRILDLSQGAAKRLGMEENGLAKIKLEAISIPDPPIEVASAPELNKRKAFRK